MKKILLILLLVPGIALAQRYASNRPADEAFTANPKDSPSTVRWIIVADPDSYCRGKEREPGQGLIRACSRFNNNTCTIITGVETSHGILGHEFRHCFEGHFHD